MFASLRLRQQQYWQNALLVVLLLVAALAMFPARPAQAAIISVAVGGSLQTAVNNAQSGDVIRLAGNTLANETVNLSLMGSAVGGSTGDLTIVAAGGPGTSTLSGNGTRITNSGAFNGFLTLDGLTFSTTAATTTPAVKLNNIRGLVVANSTFNGVGAEGCASGATGCTGLYVSVSSGTPAIALVGNTFKNIAADAVNIDVSATGQPYVTAEGNTFTDDATNAAVPNAGLVVRGSGTTTLNTSVVLNSFSNMTSAAVYIIGGETMTMYTRVVNNTITNMLGTSFGAINVETTSTATSSPTMDTIISDNQITNILSQGVLVLYQAKGSSPASNVQILRNTIDSVDPTSNKRGISIQAVAASTGFLRAQINGNTISNTGGSGIRFYSDDVTASAIITNNALSNNNIGGFSADAGIFVRTGFESSASFSTLGNITGNSVGAAGIKLQQYSNASLLFETGGAAAATYIQANNTFSGGGTVTPVGTIGNLGFNAIVRRPENRPPSAVADTSTAVVGATTTINVLANDTDADGDARRLLAFQPVSARGAIVDRNTNGTSADLSDDQLTFTPIAGGDGTDTLYYVIFDSLGLPSVNKVTVEVALDTVAPDTTITAQPANPSNDNTPTFSFTGSDNLTPVASLTYECRIYASAGVPSAFTACTSPFTSAALADGSYIFEVRAKDSANNVDPTPAQYTWTIDATAPNTTITAQPANPSNSTTASFSFTSNEVGATFECQLDGGGFTVCVSAQPYSGLAQGSHTFQVRARDAAGNVDATPASYTWTVDTTTPTADITDVTPDPRSTSVASIVITFNEAVTGVDLADLTLTRDGAPVALTGATLTGNGTSYTLGNLAGLTTTAGRYVLTLTASGSGITDAAGNALTADATDSWDVQPTVTISASDADAAEGVGDTGTFRIARANGTTGALTVNLTVNAGSGASAGDYTLSGAGVAGNHGTGYTVVIPDGAAFADLTLAASDDVPAEAAETLRLDLAAGVGYVVGAPADATVTIAASDTTVTSTTDSGEGTLRQAITNANAFAGADTITFSLPAGPQTITLLSVLPDLTDQLTINGTGANTLTVRRDAAAPASRIFYVLSGANVTVRELTITGGSTSSAGGGILNEGTLALHTVVISGSNASVQGGGLSSSGTLSVTDSTFSNNTANLGGGVLAAGATMITNSTFQGNTSGNTGAGFYTFGPATLTNVTFSGNSNNVSGTAITVGASSTSSGDLTLNNATLANNSGGGSVLRVFADNGAPGVPTARIANSIIARTTEMQACRVSGILTNSGANLANDATCAGFTQVADPRLGPLQDNGGPTLTHAPLPDSPAINAGSNALIPADAGDADGDGDTAEPLPFDQRGTGFPRRSNDGTVDIGAVEAQFPIVASVVRAGSTPTNAATVAFTVTFSDDVVGVDASDFSLATTGGQSGATITSVTAVDARTYTVTVSTVANTDGTVRLDVLDDDTIRTLPTALLPNVPLGGPNPAGNGARPGGVGQTYTVDRIAPTADIADVTPDPRTTSVASIVITFSEAVTGVDLADLTLTRDGTPVALTGATLNGSGTTYTLGGLNGLTGADGSYTLTLTASGSGITDAAGNAPAADASDTWVMDATAPVTTITAQPANPTNSTTASFSFTGTDTGGTGVASFQCALDGGAFVACTSPQPYTGLTEGNHTFQVRAVDVAGNVDATPASYTWTIDVTAPDTTINAQPANPTNSTTASFSFTSNDVNATFACSLDGAAFTTCTSAQPYSGLTQGSHTFAVRAIDAAGNVDATPATYTWTIDITAPDTTITAQPANPSNSATASFSFSGTDAGGAGVASFQCALDAGTFTTCTSAQPYTNLIEGSHTFQVRAVDAAGNVDATPASYTWQIDLTAPTVTINQASTQTDPATGEPIVFDVVFSEPVTGFAAADIALSGTANRAGVAVAVSGSGTTYTMSVSGLSSAGTLTAAVSNNAAQDAAGNASAASTSTDNTVTFSPPPPALVSITRTDANPTNAAVVNYTVTFNTSVTGVNAADFSLTTTSGQNGATIGTVTGNGTTYTVSVNTVASAGGDITLNLVDDDTIQNSLQVPLGGVGTNNGAFTGGADQTYTVDRVAPTLTISTTASEPTNADPIPVTVTFDEPVTGFDVSDLNITNGTASNISGTGASYTFALTPTGQGVVTVNIAANVVQDAVGNGNTAATALNRVFDSLAPDTTITAGPSGVTSSTSASISFTGDDGSGTGVASFECSLDGVAFALCTSPVGLTSLADGSHTFAVRAVDNAGNLDTTPANVTWTVDTSAPDTTITAGPTANTNSASASISFTSNEAGATFACALDGAAFTICTSPANLIGLADGAHTFQVRALDAAGNVDATPASVSWTIDTTPLTVTVEQAVGQADPTTTAPISFTVTFNKPVTGFDASDVTMSGSAPGTLTATLTGGPNVYSVTVSGMTSSGIVTASIAVGAAQDVSGNTSVASTSTDNSVTFNPATPVTTGIVRTSANPTNAANVAFRVTFGENVTGVDASDFALSTSGVSGATITGVIGSGTTYTVTISTGTGSGTLGLNLADDDTIRGALSGVPLGGVGAGNGNLTGEAYTLDRIAPVASLATLAPVVENTAFYTFTVVYTDNLAVKFSTLDAADIRVTGPNGYNELAQLVSATPAADGAALQAVYRIPALGGQWQNEDSGVYVVALEANQVTDAVGNPAVGTTLGQFTVAGRANGAVYLPLLMRAPQSLPDLVVDRMNVTATGVEVVVRNAGNAPISAPFWVDLYIGPRSAPTQVNQTWSSLSDAGVVWGVTGAALPIAPGGTLTLAVGDAYFRSQLSRYAATLAPGTTIYAQVDSAHAQTTYGGVLEMHERDGGDYNNIAGVTLPVPVTLPSPSTSTTSTRTTSGMPQRVTP